MGLSFIEEESENMFKYILFDLDGTLTDPKIGITTCVQYALKAFGIEEPDLDKLECFIGPPLKDSFKQFYGMNDEQAQQATAKYRERFVVTGLFENEIYPGVPEMLRQIKQSGKKISIASSKPTELVKRILEHFDIAQYFDYVVGSEMDGRRSKKEEVVEEALRLLLADTSDSKNEVSGESGVLDRSVIIKEDIAMVGDRKFDIEGAKAFGLTSVGVSFGYAPEGELEEAGAEYIVDTVTELLELLDRK